MLHTKTATAYQNATMHEVLKYRHFGLNPNLYLRKLLNYRSVMVLWRYHVIGYRTTKAPQVSRLMGLYFINLSSYLVAGVGFEPTTFRL